VTWTDSTCQGLTLLIRKRGVSAFTAAENQKNREGKYIHYLAFNISPFVCLWVGVCMCGSEYKRRRKKKLVSFQIEKQEVRFFFLKMIKFKSELWNALG